MSPKESDAIRRRAALDCQLLLDVLSRARPTLYRLTCGAPPLCVGARLRACPRRSFVDACTVLPGVVVVGTRPAFGLSAELDRRAWCARHRRHHRPFEHCGSRRRAGATRRYVRARRRGLGRPSISQLGQSAVVSEEFPR
jgi:hypothetical protein